MKVTVLLEEVDTGGYISAQIAVRSYDGISTEVLSENFYEDPRKPEVPHSI